MSVCLSNRAMMDNDGGWWTIDKCRVSWSSLSLCLRKCTTFALWTQQSLTFVAVVGVFHFVLRPSVLRPHHPCTKVTFVYLNWGKETIKPIFEQHQPTVILDLFLYGYHLKDNPSEATVVWGQTRPNGVARKYYHFLGEILRLAHSHITTVNKEAF